MITKIMNSNDFTDDAKQKYGAHLQAQVAYILNNEIREEIIEGNIEIRDDIKMKLDANKYNI